MKRKEEDEQKKWRRREKEEVKMGRKRRQGERKKGEDEEEGGGARETKREMDEYREVEENVEKNEGLREVRGGNQQGAPTPTKDERR